MNLRIARGASSGVSWQYSGGSQPATQLFPFRHNEEAASIFGMICLMLSTLAMKSRSNEDDDDDDENALRVRFRDRRAFVCFSVAPVGAVALL